MIIARLCSQGHRASIAEEERPGVFSLRVGNLMPGDVATVELTMVGVLPYRDGEVTFRFPLVVAPRYMPGVPLSGPSVGAGTAVDTNAVPDASRISPPVLLPGFPNPVQLSLTIDLYEPADRPARQPVHGLGEEQADVRRLTLQPGERLDRDFILRFRLGGDGVRTSLSLHPDTAESAEGTFALTIVPPISIVDACCHAAAQRRRALARPLRQHERLEDGGGPPGDGAHDRHSERRRPVRRSSPSTIGSRRPSWAKQGNSLVAATDRNRFKAVEFLAKVESRGGTEIAQPLDQAVRAARASRVMTATCILVLVTDGQVGNEDQVLKVLGARLKGIRVFTLGIDQAVNEGFLRRLAELGQGGGVMRAGRVGGSARRGDGLDPPADRHAGRDRRVSRAVVVGARCCWPIRWCPIGRRVLFAGSPLLLMGRYRGRPQGTVAGARQDSGRPGLARGGRSQRP